MTDACGKLEAARKLLENEHYLKIKRLYLDGQLAFANEVEELERPLFDNEGGAT
mgnify:CR=1 FL=1